MYHFYHKNFPKTEISDYLLDIKILIFPRSKPCKVCRRKHQRQQRL